MAGVARLTGEMETLNENVNDALADSDAKMDTLETSVNAFQDEGESRSLFFPFTLRHGCSHHHP